MIDAVEKKHVQPFFFFFFTVFCNLPTFLVLIMLHIPEVICNQCPAEAPLLSSCLVKNVQVSLWVYYLNHYMKLVKGLPFHFMQKSPQLLTSDTEF